MFWINWLLDPGQRKRLEAFRQAERPVVLMGRGHSGTRVLSWACAHLGLNLGTGDDLATGDPTDTKFTAKVKRIAQRELGRREGAEVCDRDIWKFAAAAHEYFQGLGAPRGLWGWKFPETYLVAPLVARTFPGSRFLHVVRDGRDIAFKTHLTDNPRRRIGRRILARSSALESPRHIQAAASWKYQVDSFDRLRQELPRDRVCDLRFEDLCLKPMEVMSQVCEFLGLEMTEPCKRYLETEINTAKVGQYRENDPALVSQVEERIGDTLRRWQYL